MIFLGLWETENMKQQLFLLITILALLGCQTKINKIENSINAANNKIDYKRIDFSSIEDKFKYSNLIEFSMDTLQWSERRNFYTKLDSTEFIQVYQDSSQQYLGGYSESIDLDFFYSKQQSKRGLVEFTILTQREGSYCEYILYYIYKNGKLISSFKVAGSCGDGGYYEDANGKFLNDSTYELLSEDNYQTEDIDKPTIINYSRALTIIKSDGTITQMDTILKTVIDSPIVSYSNQ